MAPRLVQQVCMSSVDASAFTAPEGVLVVDRGFYGLRVHDGVTPGGNLLMSSKANFADVDDPVIARQNLGLGSAALLDATVGFMLGINNLGEVVDQEQARINIQAAQRSDNTDINTIALQQDGLRIRNVDNTFKHTIKVDVAAPMTTDVVITLFLPIVDADISLSGLNTGDQSVELTGDITGVSVVHAPNPTVMVVNCTIADQAVNEQAYHDTSIPNSAFQNNVVDARVLEHIGGITGTWTNPQITLDNTGRVLAVANGSGATNRQVSGNLAVTHGTSFAHNFGVIPDVISGYLICNTADSGFIPGDVLQLPVGVADAGGNKAISLYCTPTNVTLFMDGAPEIVKADGTLATLTTANWRMRFICLVFN